MVVARLATNINPDIVLTPQQQQQWQLTSAQLLYYPTLSEIIPDIYKFCHGCRLVGTDIHHNISMLQYYADGRQYLFDNDKQLYLEFVNNMLQSEDINMSFPVVKDLFKQCKVEAKANSMAGDNAMLLAKCAVMVVQR